MLTSRSFPNLATFDALSKTSIESHVRLYEGYVQKYNELHIKLQAVQKRGPGASTDLGSLKGDLAFALGAIKNHELFFAGLSSEIQSEPSGPFAELIVKSFHSIPQYLTDLKQTAQLGRNWVWTALDLDHFQLFNYEGGPHSGGSGLPVWNSVPLLAIDLYGHSYFYDFGSNRTAYIEAILGALNWRIVGERFQAAAALATRH